MAESNYDFFVRWARILNSNQSRSVVLCGNVYDLFFDGERYVPLIPFLCNKAQADGLIQIVYELNGPIRIDANDRERLKSAWISWRSGVDAETLRLRDLQRKRTHGDYEKHAQRFDQLMIDAIGKPTTALEFLRQLTLCSRGQLRGSLLILIEAADMLLPAGSGDVSALSDRQLRRISIVQDWFCDPGFLEGNDSVCLLAESTSVIHPRVSKLPQVVGVEVPAPDLQQRRHFIDNYAKTADKPPKLWSDHGALASLTAGLSLHAVRQLLASSAYDDRVLSPEDVVAKVESFIKNQLGEDVVEFHKPEHSLEDVVGFDSLKLFLRDQLLPRFRALGDASLPGACVAGPIGSGKTFIFEAVAGELGVPVLVLKSIRSQWFGQTDVVFERLRRMLEALDRVVIFVDEADTQFGGVGAQEHSTERRLTGKVQAMMSDSRLRGRVFWLLMTARIQMLSPDIRRPGRVGDLIIPVLDPEGDDRRAFLEWLLRAVKCSRPENAAEQLDALTAGYSAAAFASLRSQLKAEQPEHFEEILEIVRDMIPPAIERTRRYQTLQALVNCTRRSLLPNPDMTPADRQAWQDEIRQLELQGVQ